MRVLYSILIVIFGMLNQHAQQIVLQQVASNLSSPTEIANAGDDRLFIVEKTGKIKILQNGNLLSSPFLDISDLVSTNSERGLLGLAFSPNFATDQYYFVNYTNLSGNTVIARFTANGNSTNISTQEIVTTITQPYSNHNGGKIAFGPDNYLYIGMGDGGSGGDPFNYAQTSTSLLGKMLRIDVSTLPYTIPSDNPFVGSSVYQPEIFALGLRNPWKFSFDSQTGDLWIADVGQYQIEEINHISSASGLNFGWRCYEGNSEYNGSGCGAPSIYTFPIAVYNHGDGRCSLTGGYVYRGTAFTGLANKYFFGDYCSGEIGVIDLNDNSLSWIYDANISLSTFGEDHLGELYVADIYLGNIYKLESTLATEDIEDEKLTLNFNSAIHDIFRVQANANIIRLEWYTMEGELITTQNLAHPSSEFKKDVSSFATGIYLVSFTFESNGKVITKKVIKQ